MPALDEPAPSSTDGAALSRLRRVARAIPVDLAALALIALAIYLVRLPFIRRGMCFNDSSWYFHFGRRALAGDVPYRDYVFQVGPLPIYVDAAAQMVFGSKYMASNFAALLLHGARVFAVWLIARRLAGCGAAALVCVFCVFDVAFGTAHHWSWAYAELFVLLSGLFSLLASRATSRCAMFYLFLAGVSAGAIVMARQATALMVTVVLIASAAGLVIRRELTARRFAALWAGYATSLLLFVGALALVGALGPALQQMFLDAPQKKSVTLLHSALDAVSGGTAMVWRFTWWGGLLTYLALPIAVVAIAIYLAARPLRSTDGAAGFAVGGIVLLATLLTRDGVLDGVSDVPRVFFTIATALAVLSPDRARRWFGVEPVSLVFLAGLPLAADWALQMSYPGRGWTDIPALVTGTVLLVLASSRTPQRTKELLCAGLAVAGVVHFATRWREDTNPFADAAYDEATISDASLSANDRLLWGTRVSASRKAALGWLKEQVPRGSTCFVYGTVPVLYDLLGCNNPTLIDVTIPDFVTTSDVERAVATLRARPPDYIIAQQTSWMNPSLEQDFVGSVEVNTPASKAIHAGLRSLLPLYETVGLVGDALTPELAKHAAERCNQLSAIRVYRRRP